MFLRWRGASEQKARGEAAAQPHPSAQVGLEAPAAPTSLLCLHTGEDALFFFASKLTSDLMENLNLHFKALCSNL